MKIGSFIYSSHSIEALKEMLREFFLVFNIPQLTPDDLFYYGVFCKDITYANFKHWDLAPFGMDIPEALTSPCQTQKGRLDYVHNVINDIMLGNISKPEWMLFIEETETCNNLETPPSTFLYLIPKDDMYKSLGERILDFLYSPNLMDYACITN